jgi:hypothetical protein
VNQATIRYDFFEDFFLGIFAPDLRASFNAIATACLRFLTFLPLPERRVPCLCSRITLATLLLPRLRELLLRVFRELELLLLLLPELRCAMLGLLFSRSRSGRHRFNFEKK